MTTKQKVKATRQCRICRQSIGKPHGEGCPNKSHFGVKRDPKKAA